MLSCSMKKNEKNIGTHKCNRSAHKIILKRSRVVVGRKRT
jgi:hypothetical protein